jgi:hypothetical protein
MVMSVFLIVVDPLLMDGQIDLTNSSVPLDIEYREIFQFEFSHWVVQDPDDLGPYLSAQPKDSNLINADSALLRFKLTFSQTETAIGVSWNHTLGDAMVLQRFMNLVSQSYQGLAPSYPPPTFQKHWFPVPSAQSCQEILPLMPHFRETYHFSELGSMYAKVNNSIVRVNKRIERDQIEALRERLRLNFSELSAQDCITAYIITVFNRFIDSPIVNVTNVASVGAQF